MAKKNMDIQQHILDVAEDLFNQHGFNVVGVDLIRDEAKVSKTTLYRRFGDKLGLVEAVLHRRHVRFEQMLDEVVSAHDCPKDKISAILDWHFDWFGSPQFKGCMFMHAQSEFKCTKQKPSEIAVDHKAWLLSLFIRALGENQVNAQKHAEMLLTFFEGMIVRAEFGCILHDKAFYRSACLKLLP
ncbi:TetR/AcrR family transcriptional regulator [Pseudoalteromonas luteoviolacea]|uniref:TetR/AcrR family transcriptional regulator n=2 Tax=Pseudoalteromonas luteoviolacea TaxID=43657 RepID=UPI001B3A6442|nr:TetR/AcrR family transcriptional regulator [Pseudoalteromonas luteoviolacea]MBQ4908147.1 TetR/AcrR family transcriptional regulator [Pseudoalteromonas luteoviolacea]